LLVTVCDEFLSFANTILCFPSWVSSIAPQIQSIAKGIMVDSLAYRLQVEITPAPNTLVRLVKGEMPDRPRGAFLSASEQI
jgi:hypothetical protein